MKLTIFGATGGTGHELVGQALAAGHEVTAVVRDPARLTVADHPSLRVVTADVTDPSALEPVISGRDVVFSALGARAGRPATTVCTESTRAISTAMRAVGVSRLVVVSASGLTTEGDALGVRLFVKPLLGVLLRGTFADMSRMEGELARGGLEWTIVRAPRLTGGPRRGAVTSRTDGNVRGKFTISRADLADFLLRAGADDALVDKTVSVAG